MLRLVLAVALAAALFVAVVPALEDAQVARTERLTERELGRVETAARTLVREEEPGAGRTLAVSLPGGSPTSAPLAFVALGGVPDGSAGEAKRARRADPKPTASSDTAESDAFAYRVVGGRHHVRRVGVGLRVVRDGRIARPDSRGIVLRGGETYRLTLRLVRLHGRLIVTVDARISPG